MSDANQTPVAPAQPPLPVWNCEFKPAEGEGNPTLDNLTVGSLFKLSCNGDIEVAWKEGGVNAAFPSQQASYSLYILRPLKLESRNAEFLVAAYKPGEHAPEYVRVMQAGAGFEIVKPKWQVKSVLKPNQQAKPYPPYGPWDLSLPLWILIALGLFVLAVVYMVVRALRRYNQRAKMRAELEKHKTALSPLHQFYRDARGIRRKLHGVKQAEDLGPITEELNRDFRLYVLRQFEVPALDWTDREIVKDLKKRHRKVYYRIRDPLRKTLRELARLTAQKQFLFKDVEQMHRMSLDTVERIENARVGAVTPRLPGSGAR